MDDINEHGAGFSPAPDWGEDAAPVTAGNGYWSGAPMILADPNSIEAEAIRALRTRIMAQHVREGRRALAICTPSENSGCTFVAANLAIAVSQIGVKVALVDTDLRTSSVAGALGIAEDRPGVAEYLADPTVTMDDIIRSDIYPSFSFIPAGAAPSNPQELLSSERFRTFVNQLLREFDLTIFDTTPANSCTDAQRVSTVAGYNLIVARKHKSYMNDVATLSKLLRADRSVIVGTVLNAF